MELISFELKLIFGLGFLMVIAYAIYEAYSWLDLGKELGKVAEKWEKDEQEKRQMERERIEALKTIAEHLKDKK